MGFLQWHLKFELLCRFLNERSGLQTTSFFYSESEGTYPVIFSLYFLVIHFCVSVSAWVSALVNCQHTHVSQWDTAITRVLLQCLKAIVAHTLIKTAKHINYVLWLTVLGIKPLPYLTCQQIFPWSTDSRSPLFFFPFSILNNLPNIFITLPCVPVWPWPVCSGALISNNNSLSWQPMCKQHSFILTWQPCHSLTVVLSVFACLCSRLTLSEFILILHLAFLIYLLSLVEVLVTVLWFCKLIRLSWSFLLYICNLLYTTLCLTLPLPVCFSLGCLSVYFKSTFTTKISWLSIYAS